jgi:hypothetical protein
VLKAGVDADVLSAELVEPIRGEPVPLTIEDASTLEALRPLLRDRS